MEFDVAFVDGRRRAECALTAAQVVVEGGIVIMHDWRRSRYAPARALFETLLEGDQMLVLRPRPLPRRPSRRAEERRVVIVPVNGKRAEREFEITRHFAEAYAASVGADFAVVGQSSTLPPHRLKSAALDVAEDYDRTLLLDADVLIRPGAPDLFEITPEASLGAFVEGHLFPREDWCGILNHVYGADGALTPQEYFNSGVLVLSRSNLSLLRALREEVLWGHPQFEQGFLNIRRLSLGIPLFPLPLDFNYIPAAKEAPDDWRRSFFFHPAGSEKEGCRFRELWADKSGQATAFSLQPLTPAHTRAGRLRQAFEQISGKTVRILDPTDLQYDTKHARPILDSNQEIVVFFKPLADPSMRPLSVWGPYITLSPGRWRLQFQKLDGSAFVYRGAAFDIATNIGGVYLVEPLEWPEDGAVEFHLDQETENIEFRIYAFGESAELAYLRLEHLSPQA
jgi:hypothetical protein